MNRLTRFILEDESGQEVSTNDITGSLEHKDIFFKKPSTNVYQEDVEYFMVSPQGVPDNLAGQSLEVLQDRYANIAFLFEKDTNYLTSKKLKLAVFESMMETLTTQFPEYAKIPQLLQRMITRQRLEIQIWERLVVNNLKVFQSADYALAMKGYEMELGEMEMSLKAAKKVRKPIILNAMDKYRNSELQAITTKLQDKFTRLFHLVLIAPKQIEVLPPRMHLVKKSEMSNELWEEEFQSSLGSELVRRVLSPALAAMRQEASNLLPGIFVA